MSLSARMKLTRREALVRLGLGTAVAYSAPAIVKISDALASGSQATAPTANTAPTAASAPSSSTKDTGSSGTSGNTSGSPSSPGASGPSGAESRRAQRAVASGRALSLVVVVNKVLQEIGGRVIKVRFSDFLFGPRYKLTMISSTGARIVVHVDASDGSIVRIDGS